MGDIPDERPLTAEERRLARWMLENGNPEARDFLPQLDRARVVSHCPCGCATINLEIDGHPPVNEDGIHVLGDFWYDDGDEVSGAFIYTYGGVLSGIEVTGLSGDIPKVLPAPESLRPLVADPA